MLSRQPYTQKSCYDIGDIYIPYQDKFQTTNIGLMHYKFECHHFVSIFEGVVPLCELRKLEVFHTFLLHALWGVGELVV